MKTWKNYKIKYCGLCDNAYIKCMQCESISCSGGGCDKCYDDFDEFMIFSRNIDLETIRCKHPNVQVGLFGEIFNCQFCIDCGAMINSDSLEYHVSTTR